MSDYIINEKDSVILYKSKNKSFLIHPGDKKHHLNITHDELINQKYNTEYKSYVLMKKYPEQMIKTIKKQTQILFEADISYILYFMNIKSGDTVLECGTGSGVLTNILSQRVCNGEIYTYERNVERYNELVSAFEQNVKIHNCDLEAAQLNPDFFDAIFLDLPEPSKVIKKCFDALKNQKMICVFLPTIEQVVEAKNVLAEYFVDIKMHENIKREYMRVHGEQKKYIAVPNQYSHTGFLIFATKNKN